MSMFQTHNRSPVQNPPVAQPPAQPIGGGGIFAGVAGAKRMGIGKTFMSPGKAWCLIRRCYEGVNQSNQANANIDMTVIAIIDPAIAEIVPPETPNRVGKDVSYVTANKPGPNNYFMSNISAIVLALTGEDLQQATPERAAEVCSNIFKHGMLENHVAEVKAYVKMTKPKQGFPNGERRVYQDFIRRVPWQEVAMLLSPQQHQQFFQGKLDQFAAFEAKAPAEGGMGIVVPGWKPGIAGTGSDTTPQAIAAAQGVPAAAAVAQTQPAPAQQAAVPAVAPVATGGAGMWGRPVGQ